MKHLTPKQAYEFLQSNPDALFIDCRSEMEYLFVGHPVGAHHVSWNDGPDWEVNHHRRPHRATPARCHGTTARTGRSTPIS